jgi:hypothetical protein
MGLAVLEESTLSFLIFAFASEIPRTAVLKKTI